MSSSSLTTYQQGASPAASTNIPTSLTSTKRKLTDEMDIPENPKRRDMGWVHSPATREEETEFESLSPADSISQVGTSDYVPIPHPTARFSSFRDALMTSHGASDVWYFVRGINTNVFAGWAPSFRDCSVRQPSREHFMFLACRLCRWKTWRNATGQTSAIRDHLIRNHQKYWRDTVIQLRLKGWRRMTRDEEQFKKSLHVVEPYSKEGLQSRIIEWMAATDQKSPYVVDCPEFRRLLLYANDRAMEEDIPRYAETSKLIEENCNREARRKWSDLKKRGG